MSLEVEKKSRSAIRREFTVIADKIKNILKNEKMGINQLKGNFIILTERHESLTTKNASINELLLGDDAMTEQQMDEELSKADKYSLEFIIIKENIFQLLERDMPVLPSADSHCSDPSLKHAFNYKLPKMKFKQTGGEIKDWLSHWGQFKKKEKMDPSDKLHYSLMSITRNSVAKKIVESFPATSEMYDNKIKALNDSYRNIVPIPNRPWIEELKLHNIYLSDINTDGAIEVLLGADVVGSLLTGNRKEVRNGLIAFETKLGWTVMGKVSKDANNCKDSVKVNEKGRIEVRLPFIENHPPLSTNYGLAMQRMNGTIKTLKSEGYYEAYQVVFGVPLSHFQLAASIEYHLSQVLAECKNGVRDLSVNLVERLKGSFCVDNCVMELAKSIMWEHKFDLRGWEFNTNDEVPPSNALGLLWDRKTDTLEINVDNLLLIKLETVTKRTNLSAAHRIFDPCGMV
ncbi:hypothetical protein ILUMI_15558 [Ignelater luminosus]|uniref:Peptidase aspartic putative domain-containing protein n=1 Tax=Ignelater luminosus TaxID=2038154 RepID=A0A8K0CNF2_IGNLU|nr:hypothetical protein ILUMI_15558 [Ignelater luminosus]